MGRIADQQQPVVDDPGHAVGQRAVGGPVGQGALVLFKLKLTSFANRPLELSIRSRSIPKETGRVELDL